MVYIIIKNNARPSIKGRRVTEFAENLQREGWPSEFKNEEALDRAKFIEKREDRPLTKSDLTKIAGEMTK